MKPGRLINSVIGFAAATWLIARQGFDAVFQSLRLAGWLGLVAITLAHLVPALVCGLGWWVLTRKHTTERWSTFAWVRWVRDGLDGVIPFIPVTGELVGIRLMSRRGVPLADASTIVDVTAELFGQVIFAAIAFALLIAMYPQAPYKLWIGGGIGILALQLAGFVFAQHRGLFRLIEHPLQWIRKHSRSGAPDAGPLHDRVLMIYRDRAAFFGCVLVHVVAWLISALEAWLGFWCMGHVIGLAEVTTMEGLVYALKSLAFFIPLGAGVQEGGYVLIGGMLGISPDLTLALSLLKRGRDLITGIPALLVWQALEARAIARARSAIS